MGRERDYGELAKQAGWPEDALLLQHGRPVSLRTCLWADGDLPPDIDTIIDDRSVVEFLHALLGEAKADLLAQVNAIPARLPADCEEATDELLLCINCEWCRPNPDVADLAKCECPQARKLSLVDGKPMAREIWCNCQRWGPETEQADSNPCGPEGKWFQAKVVSVVVTDVIEDGPDGPGIAVKLHDTKDAPASVTIGFLCCVHGGDAASDKYNSKYGLVCPQCYGEKLLPPEICGRVATALNFANRYGGIDGAHHKTWVIDQMVRALTGKGYDAWVAEANDGEDGPDSYAWDTGIAP